jgi:hypothetical protein
MIGEVLKYIIVFMFGYFFLVSQGWDNYIMPQWILLFIVAIHALLWRMIKRIFYEICAKKFF